MPFRCQSQAPGCFTCASDQWAIKQVPTHTSSGSINFLEQLTELRGTLDYIYWFIRKDTTRIHQTLFKEVHFSRSFFGEVSAESKGPIFIDVVRISDSETPLYLTSFSDSLLEQNMTMWVSNTSCSCVRTCVWCVFLMCAHKLEVRYYARRRKASSKEAEFKDRRELWTSSVRQLPAVYNLKADVKSFPLSALALHCTTSQMIPPVWSKEESCLPIPHTLPPFSSLPSFI